MQGFLYRKIKDDVNDNGKRSVGSFAMDDYRALVKDEIEDNDALIGVVLEYSDNTSEIYNFLNSSADNPNIKIIMVDVHNIDTDKIYIDGFIENYFKRNKDWIDLESYEDRFAYGRR
jgi:hypothetical protein